MLARLARGAPVVAVARIVAACLVAVAPPGALAAPDETGIVVHAAKEGDAIRVEVDCPVAAPRAVAWEVLTDYANMPKFIGNVRESTVRMRMGNRLQVFQKGQASRGPLSIDFENLREIDLEPQVEIRSRIIAGDTMPARFTTRIDERGSMLHIVHTGTYTPSMWVPPMVGPALIEAETRKQYAEIRAEIVRRAGGR